MTPTRMALVVIAVLASLASALALTPKIVTVEDMLTTPRPQSAIISPDKKHAISVVDQWDSKHDETTRSVYLLSLDKAVYSSPSPLFDATPATVSELFWLSANTVAYLNDSSVYYVSTNHIVTAEKEIEKIHLFDFPSGTNPASLQYDPLTETLGFSGMVWQDGDFEMVAKWDEEYAGRGDTGVVYDDLFIRYWDTWRTPGKVYTLGLTRLERIQAEERVGEEHFTVSKTNVPRFINVLNGTGLYAQIDPIASSAYSLSSTRLAVAIKPSHLNAAAHTRKDVYLLPLPHLTSSATQQISHLTPTPHGAISSLEFSPDGKKLAWLEMAKDGYEIDRAVLVVHDISTKGSSKTSKWTQNWDRSPSSVTWASDSESIYFLAEHEGRVLPYHLSHPDHLPTPLYFEGTTTSIAPLNSTFILLSLTSFISPVDTFILDLADDDGDDDDLEGNDGDKRPRSPLRALTDWSSKHIGDRLEGMQGEEFWFDGAEGWRVMGWAVKPRGWSEADAEKRAVWPMAFFIHGGGGAWEDAWSTRWNLPLFASQGYFVIVINPTGSQGYGQEFTDRMQNEWGGRVFKDLLAGHRAALRLFPEIDPERTVALGLSFGGYMINWINGHNDQFRFKALVCHDGVFNPAVTFYTTEEVWYILHDMEGDPTRTRMNYERWNPMNHIAEWSTPQLVIHSAKDYRLIEGEGIAAFTALQLQGVPSRFLTFPDENHYVSKPLNSRRWHHEVFRWLDEWVGQSGTSVVSEETFVVQN